MSKMRFGTERTRPLRSKEPPLKLPRRSPSSAREASGFTLVELLVVTVILAVAMNLLTTALVSSNRLAPMNRETGQAMNAVRDKIEEIRDTPFQDIWMTFNAEPLDDPGGAGTAPGRFFAVPELQLRRNDVDGFVGEVFFPTIGTELREDLADRDLGMPRDLNGDGVVDALDHSGDYDYLPFRVRLEWRSKHGLPRQLQGFSAITRQ